MQSIGVADRFAAHLLRQLLLLPRLSGLCSTLGASVVVATYCADPPHARPLTFCAVQDFNYPAAEPRSNTTARWLGLSLLQQTALTFAASQAGVNKKDMMTAMGACWGAAAAHSAYNTHKKYQKKDEGWGNTAVQAGMAGLLLWRGLRKEDK
jgi:hypothetical protein